MVQFIILLGMDFSSCAAGDGQSDVEEEDSPSTPVSPTSRQLYQKQYKKKKYRANMTHEQKSSHNEKNLTEKMSVARVEKRRADNQVALASETRYSLLLKPI